MRQAGVEFSSARAQDGRRIYSQTKSDTTKERTLRAGTESGYVPIIVLLVKQVI